MTTLADEFYSLCREQNGVLFVEQVREWNDRIEALEKEAGTRIKETAARLVAALQSLADEIEGDLAALATGKEGP